MEFDVVHNTFMISLDKNELADALNKHLSIQMSSFETVWEPCDWSQTFKLVDPSGKSYFLKGTPRERNEARLTALLHAYDPQHTPKVIHADLLPKHEWAWFLMADAGSSYYEHFSFETARKTAFAIGSLQRKVMDSPQLPELLPQCLPEQYLKILEESLAWLEKSFVKPPTELISRVRAALASKQHVFDEHCSKLAALRPSCVHTDLWSGNLALSKNGLVILDWADAVWGIGTVSIMHMLEASETKYDEAKIWNAYANGLHVEIPAELIQASQLASLLTMLLVDRRLAAYSSDLDSVPMGIPPLLEEVLVLLAQS